MQFWETLDSENASFAGCHHLLRKTFVFGKLATTLSEPPPPAHGEDARIHAAARADEMMEFSASALIAA